MLVHAVTSAFRTPLVDTVTLVGYITLAGLLAVSLALNIALIFIVLVIWRKMCQKNRELTGILQRRGKPTFCAHVHGALNVSVTSLSACFFAFQMKALN